QPLAEEDLAAEPLLLHGEVFLRQGLAGEALERFEAVLRSDPESTAARDGRARSLLELGRPEEAVAAAQASVERGGSRAVLGRALLRAGQPDRAVAA
ncbi:MAG: tetratricopeptide repeat protein, partial [Gemmatimonadetes bacterium]|nr:tetratricopeptide repeat protein [Gemmatimonadota bacterium]NIQ60073.1 tetratricopeptide repeat protein [Gemmatimonadota bacterium]NIU80282.1 tetratricopeptide repeat protein [Gammaproteobacteria bacterium]NIX48661.1 tetratricopeptide repeat protein [Gemmatimonadota bacterium]NIY13108.1 tetratricopeptide repeat protein [Gemmatimonadota bacterium]